MSQVDLTKIERPFGLLDPETQEALRKWGLGVEAYQTNGEWRYSEVPYWCKSDTYRARQALDATSEK